MILNVEKEKWKKECASLEGQLEECKSQNSQIIHRMKNEIDQEIQRRLSVENEYGTFQLQHETEISNIKEILVLDLAKKDVEAKNMVADFQQKLSDLSRDNEDLLHQLERRIKESNEAKLTIADLQMKLKDAETTNSILQTETPKDCECCAKAQVSDEMEVTLLTISAYTLFITGYMYVLALFYLDNIFYFCLSFL